VSPKVVLAYSGPKGAPVDAVRINAYLTLRASELGLSGLEPNDLVDVRIGMSGTARTGPPPKTK
jgi:hypothetical protein